MDPRDPRTDADFYPTPQRYTEKVKPSQTEHTTSDTLKQMGLAALVLTALAAMFLLFR